MIDLLRNRFSHFLEPAWVVENNEDIIVHFVHGEKSGVRGAPLGNLLKIGIRSGSDEIACHFFFMFNPGRLRLNIAIIVTFIFVKEKNVKFVGRLQAHDRLWLGTFDSDFVLGLSDVSL